MVYKCYKKVSIHYLLVKIGGSSSSTDGVAASAAWWAHCGDAGGVLGDAGVGGGASGGGVVDSMLVSMFCIGGLFWETSALLDFWVFFSSVSWTFSGVSTMKQSLSFSATFEVIKRLVWDT